MGPGSCRSRAGLCGVALGPLFGYPVVLGSVGQILCGDASNQRVGWNTRGVDSVTDKQQGCWWLSRGGKATAVCHGFGLSSSLIRFQDMFSFIILLWL